MKKKLAFSFIVCILFVAAFITSCEKSSDGPISVYNKNFAEDGFGFLESAELDSGKIIHLLNDTLFIDLKRMWTFSNCALKSIDLETNRNDSILWIFPKIKFYATVADCPAPYYRPDTTLKVLLSKEISMGISTIKIKNDVDSTLDSIMLRRGKFLLDTFYIYIDSLFADVHKLPLRTKNKHKNSPTMLRVLDSLKPRVFLWRTIKSECMYRVDKCENIVADTIYPSRWNISDTNLVPVHYACADSDSVYCINSKWKDDSLSLGSLQERPDTIWFYSTYIIEPIPSCATYNSFSISNYNVGQTMRIIRELFEPNSDETFCGPATKKDWIAYNLNFGKMVLDSVQNADSLLKEWNEAKIAPDSIIKK